MTLTRSRYVTYFNFRRLATKCQTLGSGKPESGAGKKPEVEGTGFSQFTFLSIKASVGFASLSSELGRDLWRSLTVGLRLKEYSFQRSKR